VTKQVPTLNGALLTDPLLRSTTLLTVLLEGGHIKDFGLSDQERTGLTVNTVIAIRTAASYLRAGGFLIADDVRSQTGWGVEFLLTLSLQARTILETLFNILFLYEEPRTRAVQFAKYGWRELSLELGEYREEYTLLGGAYAKWIEDCDLSLMRGRKLLGISEAEAADPKRFLKSWPTPGKMWCHGIDANDTNAVLSDARQLMKRLYFQYYKPLSGEVHGNSYGQSRTAILSLPRRGLDSASQALLKQVETQRLAQSHTTLCFFMLCCLSEVHQTVSEDPGLRMQLTLIWAEMIKIEAFRDLYLLRYEQWYPLAAVISINAPLQL
jgi:hypothetical protein